MIKMRSLEHTLPRNAWSWSEVRAPKIRQFFQPISKKFKLFIEQLKGNNELSNPFRQANCNLQVELSKVSTRISRIASQEGHESINECVKNFTTLINPEKLKGLKKCEIFMLYKAALSLIQNESLSQEHEKQIVEIFSKKQDLFESLLSSLLTKKIQKGDLQEISAFFSTNGPLENFENKNKFIENTLKASGYKLINLIIKNEQVQILNFFFSQDGVIKDPQTRDNLIKGIFTTPHTIDTIIATAGDGKIKILRFLLSDNGLLKDTKERGPLVQELLEDKQDIFKQAADKNQIEILKFLLSYDGALKGLTNKAKIRKNGFTKAFLSADSVALSFLLSISKKVFKNTNERQKLIENQYDFDLLTTARKGDVNKLKILFEPLQLLTSDKQNSIIIKNSLIIFYATLECETIEKQIEVLEFLFSEKGLLNKVESKEEFIKEVSETIPNLINVKALKFLLSEQGPLRGRKELLPKLFYKMLHPAIETGNTEIIKILFSNYGVLKDFKNRVEKTKEILIENDFFSALENAALNGHTETLRLFFSDNNLPKKIGIENHDEIIEYFFRNHLPKDYSEDDPLVSTAENSFFTTMIQEQISTLKYLFSNNGPLKNLNRDLKYQVIYYLAQELAQPEAVGTENLIFMLTYNKENSEVEKEILDLVQNTDLEVYLSNYLPDLDQKQKELLYAYIYLSGQILYKLGIPNYKKTTLKEVKKIFSSKDIERSLKTRVIELQSNFENLEDCLDSFGKDIFPRMDTRLTHFIASASALLNQLSLNELCKLSKRWHRIPKDKVLEPLSYERKWHPLFGGQIKLSNNIFATCLTSQSELDKEHAALKHCINTFADKASKGKCHLISFSNLEGKKNWNFRVNSQSLRQYLYQWSKLQ